MTDGIEAVTTSVLGLALDAASLRQQAIAANIANADAVGYVPLKVSFEAQLEDARRALDDGGKLSADMLAGVAPRIEADTSATTWSGKVRLDVEMAKMTQNAVQYQALIKGLSKHFSILSSAVNDGKR